MGKLPVNAVAIVGAVLALCGGCVLQDVTLRRTDDAGAEPRTKANPRAAADGGEHSGDAAVDELVDAGAASSSNEPVDPACADAVCAAPYTCRPLDEAYTCQGQLADWNPEYTNKTFAIEAEDVVTDARTGLTWQRRPPEIYAGCSGKASDDGSEGEACAWRDAVRYCKDLQLAGGGWRLPTKAELESLIDDTRSHPAIDVDVFPDTKSYYYWTISPLVVLPQHYYVVFFETGYSKFGDFESECHVRCVR